ncbi:hypothetical protein VNO80_01185 [Phaseolus coccineus]|uniref:Uncharacterized protein n=1 Tax=Phaseolus coccineus TaxID=3886 RepID=A0AAN9NZM3_PHACN
MSLEESKRNLLHLKKEFNAGSTKNLEVQLTDTRNEIGVLREQMESRKNSGLDALKSVSLDLDDAKKSLQKLKEPLKEAEVEKAIEASALEQIMVLSVETNASHSSTSEFVARITISMEELVTLLHKVEESDKLPDINVDVAKAQVEATKG